MADAAQTADILAKLADLHKQATEERSHYYTGSCIREAMAEIERLRAALRAVVGQSERSDCSAAMLVICCQIEAERGLAGRSPMFGKPMP